MIGRRNSLVTGHPEIIRAVLISHVDVLPIERLTVSPIPIRLYIRIQCIAPVSHIVRHGFGEKDTIGIGIGRNQQLRYSLGRIDDRTVVGHLIQKVVTSRRKQTGTERSYIT